MAETYKKISDYNELPEIEAGALLLTSQDGTTYSVSAETLADYMEEELGWTVDQTPTENSGNPVSSGGVYTALGGKANMDNMKSDFLTLLVENATLLTSNTDYNNLTTQGNYYTNSTNVAQTLVNCPVTVQHRLIVMQLYGANRLMQIVLSDTLGSSQYASGLYWRSRVDNTTWSAWKRVGTKAQADIVSQALSALADSAHSCVAYAPPGYSFLTEDPTATNYQALGAIRESNLVIFNKTRVVDGAIDTPTIYVKISGTLQRVSSSSAVPSVSDGLTLKDGHVYAVHSKYISGTSIFQDLEYGDTKFVPYVSVYELGATGNIGTTVPINNSEKYNIFTADGSKQYNLWVYCQKNYCYFENAVFSVTLEDLTESAEYNLLGENSPGMKALSNIQSGKYFSAAGRLFKATAAIASGDTIEPGTNCTQTSIVEALNLLNS